MKIPEQGVGCNPMCCWSLRHIEGPQTVQALFLALRYPSRPLPGVDAKSRLLQISHAFFLEPKNVKLEPNFQHID